MIWLELGPPPAPPLSLNAERRMHWAKRQRELTPWKQLAFVMARQARLAARLNGAACLVVVELPFATVRRRDPHNFAPTIKAIVDGLVLAGAWPDDTAEWVEVADPILVAAPAPVRVGLEPREPQSSLFDGVPTQRFDQLRPGRWL